MAPSHSDMTSHLLRRLPGAPGRDGPGPGNSSRVRRGRSPESRGSRRGGPGGSLPSRSNSRDGCSSTRTSPPCGSRSAGRPRVLDVVGIHGRAKKSRSSGSASNAVVTSSSSRLTSSVWFRSFAIAKRLRVRQGGPSMPHRVGLGRPTSARGGSPSFSSSLDRSLLRAAWRSSVQYV